MSELPYAVVVEERDEGRGNFSYEYWVEKEPFDLTVHQSIEIRTFIDSWYETEGAAFDHASHLRRVDKFENE